MHFIPISELGRRKDFFLAYLNWKYRFIGGLSPNKKSYLAPFLIYSHIYDFMHTLNISKVAHARKIKFV